MKLSKHSILRMKERTTFNSQERIALYKQALKKGKGWGSINNEKLRKYLKDKEQYNSKVKLYKGYVFIHSRNSKQLYTMYEIPEEFKDLEEVK